MNSQIRQAEEKEIDWINERYAEVEFVPSCFHKEIIAIAEFEDQKAGLGRLASLDSTHLELGGIYVFEEFRNKGIAGQIISFLLNHALPSQTVYCIPFEPLIPFYQKHGFKPCLQLEQVPKELLKKHRWCQEKYPVPTSLLVRE